MTWYTASIIMCFKLKNAGQEEFTVHEDVYAIEATNSDQALDKANLIGQESSIPEYNTEDGLTEAIFVGVRKIIEVSSAIDDFSGELTEIKTGAEVTYNVYRVSSWNDVLKIANSEEVNVTYQD